jgi:uncharacterized membrane protein SirB2
LRGKEEVVVLVLVLLPFKFAPEHAGNLKQFVHIIIPPISTLLFVFGLRVVFQVALHGRDDSCELTNHKNIEVYIYIYVNVRCLSRHSHSVRVVAQSDFQGG